MNKNKITALTICTSELIYIFCSKEAIVDPSNSSDAARICNNITVKEPSKEDYPKIFTLDFGTDGHTENQITKKGKLKITLTGPLTTPGSKFEVQRIGYTLNGMKLEGTIVYKNTTTDYTIPEWTGKIEDGKFTDLSGKVYTHAGNHTIQQTEGFSTTTIEDNVYEITEGECVVSTEVGGKLTLTVQEPLIKKHSCEFILKGKLKIEGGFLNGIIDYGNDECDAKYTYTHEDGAIYNLGL